jgi:CHAD domain-containing protein
VEEGARRLALAHLAAATAARARLSDEAEAEALHDYRVALRRLRSCLRAYRKYVCSTVTGKSIRRLRRLARGTSRSRDLEVHLAWLGEQHAIASESESAGISWMTECLEDARGHAREKMLARDERNFPGLERRLLVQLTRFRTTIRLDAEPNSRSTAVVTARGVRAASTTLKNRLHRIFGYSSEAQIHRARIAAKHLRYLIEPFAGDLSGAESVIERLKSLQSAYGDVHDAHVFMVELRAALREAESSPRGERDVVPGLAGLIGALHTRGLHAFETASAAWLRGRGDPFFHEVDSVADAIANLPPQVEGTHDPVEIEEGTLPDEGPLWRRRRYRWTRTRSEERR